jgi:hypothetical protein
MGHPLVREQEVLELFLPGSASADAAGTLLNQVLTQALKPKTLSVAYGSTKVVP